MVFQLTSPAFRTGERIPTKYTCDGENISPALTWEAFPQDTVTLALIVDDPDAPNGTFTHWVLFNLLPDEYSLPMGFSEKSENAEQGRNSYQHARYDGPCPPANATHSYHFRLFALDTRLNVLAGATRSTVFTEMQGHILAETDLIGTYARQKATTGR